MSAHTHNRIALSAHLLAESFSQWPEVLAAARHVRHDHGIEHVTLQPESTAQTVRWLPHQPENPPGKETESVP